MKPKKQSSNWYIAATHYLTAGFVVPLIGMLVLGFIIVVIPFELSLLVTGIILIIGSASFVYLGVMYSSGYLYKTYVVSNPQAIVNLSTTYIVVVTIIRFLAKNNVGTLTDINIILSIMQQVIILIVFYFASRKFIKVS